MKSDQVLWGVWHNMIQRCTNPKAENYDHYGGREITVCPEWLNDYWAFELDVGKRPSSRHQLNRIENSGNYEPGNTEWVLPYKNSAYNARRTRSDNKVGQSGVYYNTAKKRYHATITIHTRRIHLGWYVSKDMAIKVRKSAEDRFKGMIE